MQCENLARSELAGNLPQLKKKTEGMGMPQLLYHLQNQ